MRAFLEVKPVRGGVPNCSTTSQKRRSGSRLILLAAGANERRRAPKLGAQLYLLKVTIRPYRENALMIPEVRAA